VERSHELADQLVSGPDLDSDGPLSHGGKHDVGRKDLSDAIFELEPQNARARKEHPCPGGFLELAEARLQVAADI
jgi:hypothetical protein